MHTNDKAFSKIDHSTTGKLFLRKRKFIPITWSARQKVLLVTETEMTGSSHEQRRILAWPSGTSRRTHSSCAKKTTRPSVETSVWSGILQRGEFRRDEISAASSLSKTFLRLSSPFFVASWWRKWWTRRACASQRELACAKPQAFYPLIFSFLANA